MAFIPFSTLSLNMWLRFNAWLESLQFCSLFCTFRKVYTYLRKTKCQLWCMVRSLIIWVGGNQGPFSAKSLLREITAKEKPFRIFHMASSWKTVNPLAPLFSKEPSNDYQLKGTKLLQSSEVSVHKTWKNQVNSDAYVMKCAVHGIFSHLIENE